MKPGKGKNWSWDASSQYNAAKAQRQAGLVREIRELDVLIKQATTRREFSTVRDLNDQRLELIKDLESMNVRKGNK
jgi:hypothetical protein